MEKIESVRFRMITRAARVRTGEREGRRKIRTERIESVRLRMISRARRAKIEEREESSCGKNIKRSS